MPELMTDRPAPSPVAAPRPTSDRAESLLREAVAALHELSIVDPRGFTLAISQVTETTDLLLRHAHAPQRPRTCSLPAARG